MPSKRYKPVGRNLIVNETNGALMAIVYFLWVRGPRTVHREKGVGFFDLQSMVSKRSPKKKSIELATRRGIALTTGWHEDMLNALNTYSAIYGCNLPVGIVFFTVDKGVFI